MSEAMARKFERAAALAEGEKPGFFVPMAEAGIGNGAKENAAKVFTASEVFHDPQIDSYSALRAWRSTALAFCAALARTGDL